MTTAGRALVLFALWVLLVDATDEPNMLVGAACALAVAALTGRIHALGNGRAIVRPSMLRYLHRPIKLLVLDSGRVTWALLRHALLRSPSPGRFRAARYGAVSDDPEDVGRRVLTEWGASLGPNRYVIGIDADRGVMLVHELVPSPARLDPLELG